MKLIVILLLMLGIIVSGCINPIKEVPIVKVNITFVEKQGIVEAENYKLMQGTIAYINRPKNTEALSLPTITARTTIFKGKNITYGPYEHVPYKGNGTYSFNIGFDEKNNPVYNDTVRVSIYVWNANKTTGKGEIIDRVLSDIIWK